MSPFGRKPALGVSDKALHKSGCTDIEYRYRLIISDLGSTYVAKTKAQLICAFVFAYAKSRFFS